MVLTFTRFLRAFSFSFRQLLFYFQQPWNKVGVGRSLPILPVVDRAASNPDFPGKLFLGQFQLPPELFDEGCNIFNFHNAAVIPDLLIYDMRYDILCYK